MRKNRTQCLQRHFASIHVANDLTAIQHDRLSKNERRTIRYVAFPCLSFRDELGDAIRCFSIRESESTTDRSPRQSNTSTSRQRRGPIDTLLEALVPLQQFVDMQRTVVVL